jgi:flagellar hook assembly protein FlgD
VRTLVNERKEANHYDIEWDGRDANGRAVASGVYFYKLQAGKHLATKKMLMMK